ncbi:MAG: transposase family protein [Anaerolineales bacterium]|nr:transposase family protein [Anaerolineales bacterium]
MENDKDRASIKERLHTIEDPRIERKRLHKLIDILAIAICAAVCGADTWEM